MRQWLALASVLTLVGCGSPATPHHVPSGTWAAETGPWYPNEMVSVRLVFEGPRVWVLWDAEAFSRYRARVEPFDRGEIGWDHGEEGFRGTVDGEELSGWYYWADTAVEITFHRVE